MLCMPARVSIDGQTFWYLRAVTVQSHISTINVDSFAEKTGQKTATGADKETFGSGAVSETCFR